MNINTTMLDSEELLYLAIRASAQNQHEQAISHLKQAIEKEPDSAKLYYMLGAEHAEIGLYDRAIEEITKATKIDPKLDTAHFQLGLLYVTSGDIQKAIEAWKPLDQLGENNFLYLFKTGLTHLANNEFDSCARVMERGISLNQANEALNNDMRRVLKEVEATLKDRENQSDQGKSATKSSRTNNVLLSAYKKENEDKS
jgi:tetratricopeptide (TPR) repeat protein